MIIFSFVLMSRSRPAMLDRLISSITKTTSSEYEIIVGLDSDDPEIQKYLSLADSIKNCRFDIKDRTSNLHHRINAMLGDISGKYIFVLNDDCLLTNNGWDVAALNILDSFGDIVYGVTKDNSIDRINSSYAAFPIVSSHAARKLGFIMDDTYGNHGADVITYRIYQEAKKVIDLECVKIDHVLHNSVDSLLLREKDKTAIDMIHRTFLSGFNINDLFTLSIKDKAKKIS